MINRPGISFMGVAAFPCRVRAGIAVSCLLVAAAMALVLGSVEVASAARFSEFTGGITPGFSASGGPAQITAGPDGNVWFTEQIAPGRIARITPSGAVTEFTGGVTPGFSAAGGVDGPLDVASGPDGNLWFTEYVAAGFGPGRVVRITPSGVVTEFTGGTTPGFSAGGGPLSITAGPDGNLWFTEFHDPGRVARITPSGAVTEFTGGVTPGFSANGKPHGIAAGRDGNLWFTEFADPGRVARITPSGQVTEFTGGVTRGFSANGGLKDIAGGPDGNLWFTENAGRVVRITTKGAVTQFTGGITPGFSVDEVNGIAAGPDGNVWFTEFDPARIARLSTVRGRTVVTEFTGGSTPGFSAGGQPLGIAPGPGGTVWFTEFDRGQRGRIGRIALDLLTSFAISPSAFKAASSGPSANNAVAPGAIVRFSLIAGGKVRFTVERAVLGRSVRGQCVAPSARNRRNPGCTRYGIVRGSFTRAGRAGANRFRFTGRMAGKALPPSRYRLVATPARGAPNRASFRITG